MQQTASTLPYIKRATLSANPTARELFLIMEEKKTNLAVSIDVNTKDDLLRIAKSVAPHVCIIKTHINIINDFDLHLLLELQDLAKKSRIILLEDSKFTDIGAISQMQYEQGIYRIANWAHLVTASALPGHGIVKGLRKVGLQMGRGMLMLAEFSSSGSLAKGAYTESAIEMAREYNDFVIGFITQRRLVAEPYFVHLTPGVSLNSSQDDFGQRYITPKQAIIERESDVIIVGRGITCAKNPCEEAKKYKNAAWDSYQKRLKA